MRTPVLFALALLAIPRSRTCQVHYHPFSWTSQGRIRKGAIAGGDAVRGQYSDVSSLFKTSFEELERVATVPGKPCGAMLEDYRLYLHSPKGRQVWVSVEGCRVTNDYAGTGGTRFSPEDFVALKRLLAATMPPRESFSRGAP